MTIAKRLILLLAVPLLILFGIGIFTRQQLARIEERARFVSESRVVALARLGDISRTFTELRVHLRSHLLATTLVQRVEARAAFEEDQAELTRLLNDYADKRIANDQGRRLFNEFRSLSQDWFAGAEKMMDLADEDRPDEAKALLSG